MQMGEDSFLVYISFHGRRGKYLFVFFFGGGGGGEGRVNIIMVIII